MKRGLGMFVKPGARDLLLKGERQKFLTDEWPRIAEKIRAARSDTERTAGDAASGCAVSLQGRDGTGIVDELWRR